MDQPRSIKTKSNISRSALPIFDLQTDWSQNTNPSELCTAPPQTTLFISPLRLLSQNTAPTNSILLAGDAGLGHHPL
eukprot:scaffold63445_cov32-Prasinocladus_malaysianus.AAC.1